MLNGIIEVRYIEQPFANGSVNLKLTNPSIDTEYIIEIAPMYIVEEFMTLLMVLESLDVYLTKTTYF